MTKVAYKRKHLVRGLLVVSEDSFLIIMVGHMAADGSLGAGAVLRDL